MDIRLLCTYAVVRMANLHTRTWTGKRSPGGDATTALAPEAELMRSKGEVGMTLTGILYSNPIEATGPSGRDLPMQSRCAVRRCVRPGTALMLRLVAHEWLATAPTAIPAAFPLRVLQFAA